MAIESISPQDAQNPEKGREVREKESFYILVNKESKELEGVVSATLPEIENAPIKIDELGLPTRIEQGDAGNPLFTNVDRARNQLGLDSRKYALFGPYETEETAKAEAGASYEEGAENPIEQLIDKDNIRIKEREKETHEDEKRGQISV